MNRLTRLRFILYLAAKALAAIGIFESFGNSIKSNFGKNKLLEIYLQI